MAYKVESKGEGLERLMDKSNKKTEMGRVF